MRRWRYAATRSPAGKNGKLDRVLIALRPHGSSVGSELRAQSQPVELPRPGVHLAALNRLLGVAHQSPASAKRARRSDAEFERPSAAGKKEHAVLELSHELRTPLNAIIGFAGCSGAARSVRWHLDTSSIWATS